MKQMALNTKSPCILALVDVVSLELLVIAYNEKSCNTILMVPSISRWGVTVLDCSSWVPPLVRSWQRPKAILWVDTNTSGPSSMYKRLMWLWNPPADKAKGHHCTTFIPFLSSGFRQHLADITTHQSFPGISICMAS